LFFPVIDLAAPLPFLLNLLARKARETKERSMSSSAGSIQPSANLLGWLRRNPYLLGAAVLFLGMGIPFMLRNNSEWDDVYVRAANHLRAGEPMYQPTEGYVYPPFMAMLALPCTFLPPVVERLAFYLVSISCTVCLCRWAWQLAGGGPLPSFQPYHVQEHWIWALGLACGFRYVIDGISHQQTDLVIGALVMAGCLCLSHARSLRAATWFGLAAGAKCTPLLWCAYFLWRRQWRAAGWLVTVAVGVNLLPDLVCTSERSTLWVVQWYQDYLAPMTQASFFPGMWYSDPVYNQSLAGAAHRWFATDWTITAEGFTLLNRESPISAPVVKASLYVIEAALLGGAAVVLTCRSNDQTDPSRQAFEYCVVLLLMLLLSPMSSKPHFCTLLLPGFCLARRALTERNWLLGLLLAAAILVGAGGIKGLLGSDAASAALWWGNVMWSTLLLLAGCCYVLLGRGRSVVERWHADWPDKQAA
jgi:hypothetical protein